MSGAAAASFARLKRRALSLGAVKSADYATRFLLPVLLVRCLDTATFGEYRLLWLVIGTVMIIANLNMCASLYFFVPRSEPGRKRLYIHQTMLFLGFSGVLFGLLVSPWNPLLPAPLQAFAPYGWLVPAFLALWVFSYPIEQLPSIEERIRWQAWATLTVSALRVIVVALAAWFTGEFAVIMWGLLGVVLLKLALLLYYVKRRHGLGAPWFERAAFAEQFRHAAPIGLNNALNGLRAQGDQWVAAAMFALSSFAAFSIASLVGQMMTVLRTSVLQAFLPSMSRMHAGGDLRGMLDMNSRGNVLVGRILYPLLAFTFVLAEELITLIYTASYAEAAPAVRLYIIGMLPMAIEIGSLVLLLRRGAYALAVTVLTLVLSVALSWTAAQHIGLAGAALGSVTMVYLERVIILRHVSRHTGIALRRLQNWRALAASAAFAAGTAAIAWAMLDVLLGERAAAVRVVAAAALFAVAYGAVHARRLLPFKTIKDAT
jgi:O-antigen/teichoic acid export membrane protein